MAHAPDKGKVIAAFLPLTAHRHPAQRAGAAAVLLRCCQAAVRGGEGGAGLPPPQSPPPPLLLPWGKETTERVGAATARLLKVN